MSDVAWLDFVADEHLSVYQLLHVTRLARGKVMQTDLCMMAVGLLETRKGLKDTNSVYCHCDLMAKHSLKLLMGSNPGGAVRTGQCNRRFLSRISGRRSFHGHKHWDKAMVIPDKFPEYSITISPGLLLLLPLFLFLLPALYFMISAIYINKRRGSGAAVRHLRACLQSF